ncbi:MAG: hypothetical protein IPG45_35695 [Deltaproteobacteria bacterium]|nr:hypothetical protein [Deltaproteobacteria bacterium]
MRWAWVCLLWVVACGGSEVGAPGFGEPLDPVPLLDPFALTPVKAEADPFVDHRPAEFDCPAATWGPEGGGFEVQTGACNYAAFDQPLPMPVEVGDRLSILVWHDLLDSAEPGTAHLAVWVGTTVLWQAEVDIPAPSGTFEAVVPIASTPAADARLGLHLHNHGFNSWRFVEVDLQRD